MRYSSSTVNLARKMADKGLTYREISKKINVDDSNIAIWCRGSLENNPRQLIKKLEDKRDEIRNSEINILDKIHTSKAVQKLYCAIIYGCEGAKYPATNCVALTNSDPKLVKTFIVLFRNTFNIDETKFRVLLQIHNHFNYKDILNYWSTLLDISKDKFYRPIITRAGNKKHRYNYIGTCTIKYYNYKLQLKLIGIYEEFMRKSILQEESDSSVHSRGLLSLARKGS